MQNTTPQGPEGILPVNKPAGITSFTLVRQLRKLLNVQKIGHAGTLDPFATGVMVMLIGRRYTQKSDTFLNQDKEYEGRLHLGIETDTYDCEGEVQVRSDIIPTLAQVEEALQHFQGNIEQIPPMFSAKKINGKKLYELARKGVSVERKPVSVSVDTELLNYSYPFLDIKVRCSKGTYIRSIAYDLGRRLQCGAHLNTLTRTRSGNYSLADCLDGLSLNTPGLHFNAVCDKMQSLT